MDINKLIDLYINASEDVRVYVEQILEEGLLHPDIPLEHSQTARQIYLFLNPQDGCR